MPSTVEENQYAKQFCKDFQTNVKTFIQEKERLNSKNAKVGGRSIHEAAGHAYFSAKAPFRAVGAKLKNPDHQDAQKQRDVMLSYAHYLNWLAYEIGKSDNSADELKTFYKELKIIKEYLSTHDYKSNKFIGDQWNKNSILYGAEQRLAQLENESKLSLSENVALTRTEKKFILLWPQFLNLENMSECFLSGISYRASDVYKWATENNMIVIEACTSFDGLRDVFQKYTDAKKNELIRIESKVNSETLQNEANTEKGAKIKAINDMTNTEVPSPIGLISVVKLGDKAMEMDIDREKYQAYCISGFDDNNQPLNGGDNPHFEKNEPLADGWYQYVIVADKDENGKSKEYDHDFRYYPCAKIKPEEMKRKAHAPYGKYIAHSQISGGLPIYAGGAFRVQNGVIDKIDNSSGHYPTNENNMNYAGKRLGELGMKTESELIIKVAPPLSGELKKARNKTKLEATGYAIFSVGGNDMAQRSENRPILPLSIQEKSNNYYDRTKRLQGYLNSTINSLSPPSPNPGRVIGGTFKKVGNNNVVNNNNVNNNNANNNNPSNSPPSSPKR